MNSVRGWLAALIMGLTGVSTAHAATKIVFLYTAVPSYIGSFVAKDEGLFEKYGLDVELIMAATCSIIPAAMVAGSAQVGAPTPTVLLQANCLRPLPPPDLRADYVLTFSHVDFRLFVITVPPFCHILI